MANLILFESNLIPGGGRYIQATQANLNSGDTFRIYESIYKAAHTITITTSAGCDLSVQFNRWQPMAPQRNSLRYDNAGDVMAGQLNWALEADIDNNPPLVTIGTSVAATTTFADVGFLVNNITVTYTTGTFTILAS